MKTLKYYPHIVLTYASSMKKTNRLARPDPECSRYHADITVTERYAVHRGLLLYNLPRENMF